MMTPRSDNSTLVSALRILSSDIISEDGIVPCCLLEAADRIEELAQSNLELQNKISTLLEQGRN
jgi:hypothetical protein